MTRALTRWMRRIWNSRRRARPSAAAIGESDDADRRSTVETAMSPDGLITSVIVGRARA